MSGVSNFSPSPFVRPATVAGRHFATVIVGAGINGVGVFRDLSLQGPLAVEYLEKHIPGVRALPYMGHMPAMLFGKPITLSRTGYTGERGYEIFCRGQDAGEIWDRILEEGASMGIIPCRFTTLDMLRAESYLLFFPFDNSEMYPFENEGPGDTLWELGLDWTVTKGKTGFRGAEEHYRLQG
ncbi:MAG: aminomethyl transferase family protein, partial [Comamonadaceae bacterium]